MSWLLLIIIIAITYRYDEKEKKIWKQKDFWYILGILMSTMLFLYLHTHFRVGIERWNQDFQNVGKKWNITRVIEIGLIIVLLGLAGFLYSLKKYIKNKVKINK